MTDLITNPKSIKEETKPAANNYRSPPILLPSQRIGIQNKQDDSSILDDVIAVDTEEFDKFLEKLKSLEFRKTSRLPQINPNNEEVIFFGIKFP